MIVHNKMRGLAISSKEIFGSFGMPGISSRYNFFIRLFVELKIRFDNKQNISPKMGFSLDKNGKWMPKPLDDMYPHINKV